MPAMHKLSLQTLEDGKSDQSLSKSTTAEVPRVSIGGGPDDKKRSKSGSGCSTASDQEREEEAEDKAAAEAAEAAAAEAAAAEAEKAKEKANEEEKQQNDQRAAGPSRGPPRGAALKARSLFQADALTGDAQFSRDLKEYSDGYIDKKRAEELTSNGGKPLPEPQENKRKVTEKAKVLKAAANDTLRKKALYEEAVSSAKRPILRGPKPRESLKN